MKFSLIVPVYNRPDEMEELLGSLKKQDFTNFELVVVEDGSSIKSEEICNKFKSDFSISYFYKENEGPSIGRNFGAQKANGEYLIFTDSDCILPSNYLSTIAGELTPEIQGYGGPDESHPDFNDMQKAISYSMTSFLTTGGIRARKKNEKNYVLRSFNMTILKEAFLNMGGFPTTKLHPGEDTIFGIDFLKAGYKTKIISEAHVYHKRRNSIKSFYKQIFNFGKVRYLITKLYPKTFKITFLFPTCFVLFALFSVLISPWTLLPLCVLGLYILAIFVDSTIRNKSIIVGWLSAYTTLTQFIGYHIGFSRTVWKVEIKKEDEFNLGIIKKQL
ncbi:MAG: glycosyltransferase [Flavobacteriales bacterium]